jgi:acetoacetate decarboxylase
MEERMKQGEVCRNFELDWMACDGGGEIGRIDADYAILTAKGDPEYLRKIVPSPLVPTDDVIIYMGWFKETVKDGVTTWAWPFHEWGIGVVSHLKDAPEYKGNFLVQLYVDDDLVMAHGREVWGYPKKIAQCEISPLTSDDSTSYDYSVTRRGTELVTGSVDNLEPIPASEFPFYGKNYAICFKQIPAASTVSIPQQEIVFVQIDFEAKDTAKGSGTINLTDGPFDQFPVGPLTNITGYFGRCEFKHHGLANLVVDAHELARPLDLSVAGKSLQAARA